jgi:hypothetical protein
MSQHPPIRHRTDRGQAVSGETPTLGRDFGTTVEGMRIAIVGVGVFVALCGLLFALQGFGLVGGSPMSNTTTWSILGPVIALIGLGLVWGAVRRRP